MSHPKDLDDYATEILRLQRKAFGEPDLRNQALVLAEESGEVCRAIVKRQQGIRPDDRGDVASECADILFVTLGIIAMEGGNADALLRGTVEKFRARVKSGRYLRGEE